MSESQNSDERRATFVSLLLDAGHLGEGREIVKVYHKCLNHLKFGYMNGMKTIES